jgi:hypothetical protein
VAEHGWRLLPDYRFDARTGQWTHRGGRDEAPMRLTDVRYGSGKLEYHSAHVREPEWALERYLDDAIRVMRASTGVGRRCDDPPRSADFEELRWFWLPSEVVRELDGTEFAGDSI